MYMNTRGMQHNSSHSNAQQNLSKNIFWLTYTYHYVSLLMINTELPSNLSQWHARSYIVE